jgi:hypothetical protein
MLTQDLMHGNGLNLYRYLSSSLSTAILTLVPKLFTAMDCYDKQQSLPQFLTAMNSDDMLPQQLLHGKGTLT